MATDLYTPPTNLEVPGLEAIIEYGDASKAKRDRIPGAMLINDHSHVDRVRVTQMDGLHDDPEGSETRTPNPDRHGERAGNMLYRGRTVGLTGRVEAGNIGAMRNNWRRFRGQFGTTERDLLVHHPFEVRALVNEVLNPSLAVDSSFWDAPVASVGSTASALTGGVTDGIMKVGSMTITGAPGAATLRTTGSLVGADNAPVVSEWSGEDVWITVRIKSHSSSGGTVTSLALGLAQWTYISPGSLSSVLSAYASVVTPASGTWQTLTFRVPATAIPPAATHVTPYVVAAVSAGTHTVHFYRCAAVLLDPAEPSPSAYFDGDTSGFSWTGLPSRSTSIGPTHAQNKIDDPRFEKLTPGSRLLSRWTSSSGVATYAPAPTRSSRWSGDHVDGSLYVKATKIATSSAPFGVVAKDALGNAYYSAEASRIYRFAARLNVLQNTAGGGLNLTIIFLNEAGSAISTFTSDVVTLGEGDYSVMATAPARTVAVQALVQVTGSTTAGSVLEFYLSDPCFVDITDWDPGDFFGVGDAAEEVGNYRRIPRPFLLAKVRKTSDMKAPEQQSRSRAWRDFTMSLRASDPRIYCLDRRRRSYELPLKSLVKIAMQNPSSFTLHAAPAAVPTGATYEGQNLPTGINGVRWTNFSRPPGTPGSGSGITPYGGVNLDLWTDRSGSALANLVDRPTNPIIARFYRSLEGYTYTEPRVIAGCSPVAQAVSIAYTFAVDSNAYGYASVYASPPTVRYSNDATVLLKRVNSTTWLELRWKALSNARMNAIQLPVGATQTPSGSQPWAFELWCSHNASGTLTTTRLATWDYTHGTPINVPFDPGSEKAYLDVSLVDDLVTWSLWVGAYPAPLNSTLDSPHKVESGSYAIPSGLAAVVGSAVAGQAGFSMKVDNAPNDSGAYKWPYTAANPPFVHYLRFSNAADVAPTVEVPVIGDSDTAPEIVLNGLMIDPVVSVQAPREDGSYDSFSIFLEGTVDEGDQLTIGNGKIVDRTGNNRYGMLRPGSRVPMLQPGINYATLSAIDWNESLSENMSLTWRDALR
jgi:hypothetical protein